MTTCVILVPLTYSSRGAVPESSPGLPGSTRPVRAGPPFCETPAKGRDCVTLGGVEVHVGPGSLVVWSVPVQVEDFPVERQRAAPDR